MMKTMMISKKALAAVMALTFLLGLVSIPATASAAAPAVDTVMAKMTLYDYEKSSEKDSKYFLFGQEASGSGDHNSWIRERDLRITRGIAQDTLNSDGGFELNRVYKTGWWENSYALKETPYGSVQLTVPGTSSGKLFRGAEQYGVYTMPFNYNPDNGRYEYDSARYKLTANSATGVMEVSEYAAADEGLFLPIPAKDGGNNYYFGAVTELPFVYANGGEANGEDMVFEFTGDDDIWVYVDGKLALDMGGIHGPVKGVINFRNLTATTTEEDSRGREIVQTSQLQDFDTSEKNHTIKVFYLERGAGKSNFKASFNLIQPTNYMIKYYDGKLYDGKTGDQGLLATVTQSAREDGTFLYPGDEIKQNEIKINVNDKTAALIASGEYYGGFVVDDNFMAVTDPNAVVTTVTEDDTDIVYVIFLPKPSYTVTYWTCAQEDRENPEKWVQITQKAISGSVGQKVTVDDIETAVEFGGLYYEGAVVTDSDENGVLGTLSADTPFNVDVLCVQKEKPSEEPGIVVTDPKELDNNYAYIFGRTDTLMEADDTMKRGEVAAVLYRLLKQNNALDGFVYNGAAQPVFGDLQGRWDRSALEYMEYIGMYQKNLGNIGPEEDISRGEAFKMTALALGFTPSIDGSIKEYTQIFVDKGYVVGDDGGLRLEDPIKRGEFCKIYNLIIGRDQKGLTLSDGTPVTAETYGFTDLHEGQWYYDVILKATSAYDEDGFVSLDLRGQRNQLDDYV